MWEQVTEIPNEPGQMVSVIWARELVMRFGPNAGKTVKIPAGLVGSSACEISAEESSEGKPVRWRFFRGLKSGGDDLKSEPAWDEFSFELPSDVKGARERLEEELSIGWPTTWFVLRPGASIKET